MGASLLPGVPERLRRVGASLSLQDRRLLAVWVRKRSSPVLVACGWKRWMDFRMGGVYGDFEGDCVRAAGYGRGFFSLFLLLMLAGVGVDGHGKVSCH